MTRAIKIQATELLKFHADSLKGAILQNDHELEVYNFNMAMRQLLKLTPKPRGSRNEILPE